MCNTKTHKQNCKQLCSPSTLCIYAHVSPLKNRNQYTSKLYSNEIFFPRIWLKDVLRMKETILAHFTYNCFAIYKENNKYTQTISITWTFIKKEYHFPPNFIACVFVGYPRFAERVIHSYTSSAFFLKISVHCIMFSAQNKSRKIEPISWRIEIKRINGDQTNLKNTQLTLVEIIINNWLKYLFFQSSMVFGWSS